MQSHPKTAVSQIPQRMNEMLEKSILLLLLAYCVRVLKIILRDPIYRVGGK